jgi:hypothetical protein
MRLLLRRSLHSSVAPQSLKDYFLRGNFVNPNATNPLLPEEFRFPAPADQPAPSLKGLPDANPDLGTIAYHPRSSRRFVEPQTLVLSVSAQGVVAVDEKATTGTQDAPFTPVTTAKEALATLKVNALGPMKAAALDNFGWDKPFAEMGNQVKRPREIPYEEWFHRSA